MKLRKVARRFGWRLASREAVGRLFHREPILRASDDQLGRLYELRCRRCDTRLTTRDLAHVSEFGERHFRRHS